MLVFSVFVLLFGVLGGDCYIHAAFDLDCDFGLVLLGMISLPVVLVVLSSSSLLQSFSSQLRLSFC